jgi:hypothetical protein
MCLVLPSGLFASSFASKFYMIFFALWYMLLIYDMSRPSQPIDFIILTKYGQSQSYVTTDGQSASLSMFQAPVWGPRPDFYYYQTVSGLLMWGTFTDERTGLSSTTAAGPQQRSQS